MVASAACLALLLSVHMTAASAFQYGGRKSMSVSATAAPRSVGDNFASLLTRSACSLYGMRSDALFNIMKCDIDNDPVPPREEVSATADRKPVVLVPGFGGSGIDATIDGDTYPGRPWWCAKKRKSFHIWFNIFELLSQECQFEELTLPYNATAKSFAHTHPGVTLTATDFGGTKGVDFLERVGNTAIGLTSYLSRMIKSLEGVGYKSGVDVHGAPYDFRLPPDEPVYLASLRSLIEDTYTKNGGKKVVLVAHSFGCINALELLYQMDADWKATYIDTFVPIAGPWIGTSKSLRAVLLGTDFGVNFLGISILSRRIIQGAAKTFPGLLWMLPAAGERWEDTVVAKVGNDLYTADNVTALIREVGLHDTADAYEVIKERREERLTLPPPGVSVTCMYGSGVKTEGTYSFFEYDEITPGKVPPRIDNVDGDGTVPTRSLGVCKEWIDTVDPHSITQHSDGDESGGAMVGRDALGNTIEVRVFKEAEHAKILDLPELIQTVLDIVVTQ